MATKIKDGERLDSTHIERVLALLEPKDGTKPGTKKDACQILGITYNTTRLGTILEKYKEAKERDKAKRAEKRGKPASQAEISYAIQAYLEGDTIDSISKALFRGPTFIGSILRDYAVPIRQSAHSYFHPTLIPDAACREEFGINEKVYSARYDSLARIDKEFAKGVYRIYLLSDKWLEYAYQPAEELASLEHLRKAGISV
jgi:hypothetical protein